MIYGSYDELYFQVPCLWHGSHNYTNDLMLSCLEHVFLLLDSENLKVCCVCFKSLLAINCMDNHAYDFYYMYKHNYAVKIQSIVEVSLSQFNFTGYYNYSINIII